MYKHWFQIIKNIKMNVKHNKYQLMAEAYARTEGFITRTWRL